ncbi:uncharacterized protein EV420DRAFT_1647401 [Desarmillaria tabescens]|uniref:Uncharacterized protein n=1 Tax=Armillaria tabescens TaxID=1929756 RepID=A0AA39MWC0_ARMTA|nr:uncharacterized protein EV420DRAFT_1647401 [Desarmillaria tabescens]KAK0448250.1 hypothetical protein EV420DRAFT_1647401 [Desarmillaria tabescens]
MNSNLRAQYPDAPLRTSMQALHKPLEDLTYSAVGRWCLARHLNFPSIVRTQAKLRPSIETRLGLMEIGWFAAGCHRDQRHSVSRATFHSAFDTMRGETETKGNPPTEFNHCRSAHIDGLMDVATLLDRAFGGCTMVIHSTGTLEPGQEIVPEHLKTLVYFTPHMLVEYPELDAVVAKVNQIFIEEVAVRGAERWKAAAAARGWSMTGRPTRVIPPPDPRSPLLPPAEKDSCVFTIRGCAVGSLEEPLERIRQRFNAYKNTRHPVLSTPSRSSATPSACPASPTRQLVSSTPSRSSATPPARPTSPTPTSSTPLASPHPTTSHQDTSFEIFLEDSDEEDNDLLELYSDLIRSLQEEVEGLQEVITTLREEEMASREEMALQHSRELSQMHEELRRKDDEIRKLSRALSLKSKVSAEGSALNVPKMPEYKVKTSTPIKTTNSLHSLDSESDLSTSLGSVSANSALSLPKQLTNRSSPAPRLPLASPFRLPHIALPQRPETGYRSSDYVGIGPATCRFARQYDLGIHWADKFRRLSQQDASTWYRILAEELSVELAAEALLVLRDDLMNCPAEGQ